MVESSCPSFSIARCLHLHFMVSLYILTSPSLCLFICPNFLFLIGIAIIELGNHSGKRSACQCGRWGFDPWVGKILLEEEVKTLSNILTWEIPWTKKPGRLQSTRSQKNWTWMSNWTHTHTMLLFNISSVQFSHSVVSDYLWPHELQHARSPCPSPTPRVYSDSHPSSQWCHPAISTSTSNNIPSKFLSHVGSTFMYF